MSLGELLMAREFQNFVLIVSDGYTTVSVDCMREVLRASSEFFKRTLGGSHFFFYRLQVPKGYTLDAVQLVRYFYTHDTQDLKDPLVAKELAVLLECPALFNFLQHKYLISD
jgi:hypothetical protein